MLVFNHMPSPLPSHAAYLLAGGKSSRMGENKAFINFHGQTLLDRALAALTAACDSVTIVGDPGIFGGHGPVIPDLFPGCGPLGGIHAALAHSSFDLNVMLAVDMPFVSAELLRFLLREAENGASGAIVTVPRTSRGLQPLCAVYRRAFAPVAEEALKAGSYKIDAAFDGVAISVVAERELAAAGFSDKDFFNVNTPEDRRAADES
jgi:molybdenum cofactor guanylyltransferase